MDTQIRRHAEIITEWSTEIQRDDNVVITASPDAHELVIALHQEIAEKEANPVTLYSSDEAGRTYLMNHEGEFSLPDHQLALIRESDALIRIRSDPNQMTMNSVPGEKLAERAKVMKPIQEEMLSKRWCLTQHPTNSFAQLAEMSLSEYRDFVYSATLRDWEEVHDMQEELRERLTDANEVEINGPDTEIKMSVEGMKAINSDGKHNLPSGEVFTAPNPDSVEGEILFDKPLIHQGREIENVHLVFENGEVTESSADRNQEALNDLLDTDDGAKRLGELGIGTNRQIDRFTYNMLFDEKMGDTIHMALGRAYDENIGEGRTGNESAIHVDMIKDMSKGTIKFDGEVIQKNGEFTWE